MQTRVDQNKREWLEGYEKDNRISIQDFTFQPGDSVLASNSKVESSLDKKMKPRYLGPMIVISQSQGSLYVIAELDGLVYYHKVAGFRVIPYFAWENITLPDNLEDLIEISKTMLKKIEEMDEYRDEVLRRNFNFEGIPLTEVENDDAESSD